MLQKCPECGAAVGGREACRRLFEEVLAREFGDIAYFGANRTLVDCYALQHPQEYCASFKSFAAHLAGLCCAVKHDSAAGMMRAVHVGLNGRRDQPRPPLVASRWQLTIDSVHGTSNAASHTAAVLAWAASVWEGWREYHGLAEQLLNEAVKAAQSRKRHRI